MEPVAGLGVLAALRTGSLRRAWQLAGKREGTAGSRRGSRDRRKIQQNPYRIRFFWGIPRRGTVEVVFSFLAGTMCDSAECPDPQGPLWGRNPFGAEFNKIPTKFRILRGGVPSRGVNLPV